MYHALLETPPIILITDASRDRVNAVLARVDSVERNAVMKFQRADSLPPNSITQKRALYRDGLCLLVAALDDLDGQRVLVSHESLSTLLLKRMQSLVQHCERTRSLLQSLECSTEMSHPIDLEHDRRTLRMCNGCGETTRGMFCHCCGVQLRRS
jgi:hypothetical protein